MTLDGPFPVLARGADGELTADLSPGVHHKTDLDTLSQHAEALAPYTVTPAALQSVWAGDDPEKPAWTISLRFPDDATAQRVLTDCGLLTPPAAPPE